MPRSHRKDPLVQLIASIPPRGKLEIIKCWLDKEVEIPDGWRVRIASVPRDCHDMLNLECLPFGWAGNPIINSVNVDEALLIILARLLPERPIKHPKNWRDFFAGHDIELPPRPQLTAVKQLANLKQALWGIEPE